MPEPHGILTRIGQYAILISEHFRLFGGEVIMPHVRHPGSVWIDANYSTLPNNEWVAADKNGLVDHDPSINSLMERLKKKNIKMDDICLAFITTDAIA